MNMLKSVAVFCGSNTGNLKVFRQKTVEIARYIVSKKMTMVFGGGKVGLMGILADEIIKLGGHCIGVIPEFLRLKEVVHPAVKDMQVTQNMHERKLRMYSLADAFIVLPGGLGTLDELFEISTWSQLNLHSKPIIIYNIEGYYDHLLQQLEKMSSLGFIKSENLELIKVVTSLEGLEHALHSYNYISQPKWIKHG